MRGLAAAPAAGAPSPEFRRVRRALLLRALALADLPAPHLEALAYHLGEVAAGRCQRLLITVPPRSLKWLFASIALPAFVLGHDPTRKLICVSYAGELAVAHANSFRAIVNTRWYQDLFPGMRVDPRKDTETEVRTTSGGFRLTTTVGGSLTGRGGSIIIIDDPIKASDAQP